MQLDKQEFNVRYMDDEYFLTCTYEIASVIANKFKSQHLDDYIQLAVFRAFSKRHLYNPGRQTAFSYFYRIVHNEFRYQIREELRKAGIVKLLELDDNIGLSRAEDWIRINGKWYSSDDIEEIKQKTKTRHKFIKYFKEANK